VRFLLLGAARAPLLILPVLRFCLRHAAPEGILEIDGTPVLAQQIAKSFIRELLKTHHAVTRQHVEGMPCFQIELDALAFSITIGAGAGAGLCRRGSAWPLAPAAAAYHLQRRSALGSQSI